MRPLKIDFHAHTSDDPRDAIPYSSRDLIDRAAALGYDALAITLHDRQLDVEPLRAYAAAKGVMLIPGIERTVQGRHVLLINFAEGAEDVQDFDDVALLKRRDSSGIVIAPHPFYPTACALGRFMDRCESLFDAVEFSGLYARGASFNKAAVRWAAAHAKPVVGNGDVHRLVQLGPTYSLVHAEPDVHSICEAVRAGRVEVRTRPLSWFRTVTLVSDLLASALVAGTLWDAPTRQQYGSVTRL